MLGAKITARSRQAVLNAATPPSGRSQEAIWDQRYDTQTYPTTGVTSLTFFSAVNPDKTLSNMEAAGQFPAPQTFQIHQICLDVFPAAAGISTSTSVAGNVDDMQKILLQARGTWMLTLSSKNYGPYSLTTLHATGGAQGFISSTVATSSQQHARNEVSAGWNYCGGLIIPEQTSFSVTVAFQGTLVTVATAHLLRLSLFGALQRRVL